MLISAEREMNAEARNHEKDDDRGSSENDALPGMRDEPAEGCGYVDAGKDREDFVVAYGDPEGQNEAQGIEDGIVAILCGSVLLCQAFHPSRIDRGKF